MAEIKDKVFKHTRQEFMEAATRLGYEEYLPGTAINFTLPQVIRMIAEDYFTCNPRLNMNYGNSLEVVRACASEFNEIGYFIFKA